MADLNTTTPDQAAQQMATSSILAGGQPVDPQATPGTGTIDPQQTPPQQMMQTTPPAADAEIQAAAVHHGRIAQSLIDAAHAISDVLGGAKSYTVTTDANGNPSIKTGTATEGEKWGRIAAGLLSGAAKGFAAGQGVGGAGRAVGAGFDQGVQAAQAPKQQAEQDLGHEEQVQQFNANKALTQQKIGMNAITLNQMGAGLSQEMVDRANANAEWLQSNPNNQKVASFGNMDDLAKYESLHPELLQGHTNSGYHVEMEPGKDGKPEFTLYTVDKNWLEQLNDKDVSYKVLTPGNTADAPMELKDKVIKAGTMKNKDISLSQEGQTKLIGDYQIKLKGLEDKATQAAQTSADRESANADRKATQQESIAARRDSISLQREIAQGKGYISGEPVPPAPAGSYDAAFPPVQNFPAGTDGIVKKNIGKPTADVSKAARLGKSAIQNSQDAINIINAHPDLVGRLNSLGSRWQQAVGVSKDDPLTALQAAVEQSTQASLGAHNLRSARYMQQKEEEVTNSLKNDPGSIASYLNQRIKSNQQFVNEERNYNLYGTSYGPDRGHDVSRGQAGQQPSAGQNPPAAGGGTPTPAAAPQPNPTGATHSFSPSAWKAKNPTGDVNAAIAAAKAQGIPVTQ